MRFCTKCGKPLPKEAKFCTQCGTPVSNSASVMASQYLEIAKDSAQIVNTTKKPEVFFPRLNLLIEKMEQLAAMEKLVSFSRTMPSAQLAEIKNNRDLIIQSFLERYYEDAKQKIEALKSSKAKCNNAEKFAAKVEPFIYELSEMNLKEFRRMSAELRTMYGNAESVTKDSKDSNEIPKEVLKWGWYISISFCKSSSANFERALFLAKNSNFYFEYELYGNKTYQAFFKSTPIDYLNFIQLYKLAGYWKSSFFMINGKSVDRRTVDWLNYCYGEKCRTGTLDFCSPADPEVHNPFGCDRLQMSSYGKPWWSFAHFDSVNYNIDKSAILKHIKTLATDYEYCPLFNWNNVYKAIRELPFVLTKQQYEQMNQSSYNQFFY